MKPWRGAARGSEQSCVFDVGPTQDACAEHDLIGRGSSMRWSTLPSFLLRAVLCVFKWRSCLIIANKKHML